MKFGTATATKTLIALLSTTLAASAALLLGCDGRQPFEPSPGPEGGPSAAKGALQLAAPSNATAVGNTETRIDVAWQDNSNNESAFEIHRSMTGAAGAYTLLRTLSANVVSFRDTGLDPTTQYCYRVRAVRVTGSKATQSAFSNSACAQPTQDPGALPAPSNLSAVAVSDAQVDLIWQDNSSGESGFWITRSSAGETGYFADVGVTAADAEAFSDLTARADTRYCYKIYAIVGAPVPNGYSFSAWSGASNISCATVPPFSAAPVAAADVMATPQNWSTVEVRWRANSTNATGFRLYRSTDNGQQWTLILAGTGTGVYTVDAILAFTDTGRESERQVCYRAIAFNSAGDAPPSEMDCTTPPAPVTSLVATRVDAQTVDLTWSDNSHVEERYEVWAAWSSPYRCWGGCNADILTDFFRMAEVPANSVSYRCANCGEMWFDERSGEWGFIVYLFVIAVKDGGGSGFVGVEFPQ